MAVIQRRESKLLGRTEVTVDFGDTSGALSRPEAVKLVAGELGVDSDKVGIISIRSGFGSRNMVGVFHVYDSKETMSRLQEKHLGVRLLSKEKREALKQARKQAKQPKAK